MQTFDKFRDIHTGMHYCPTHAAISTVNVGLEPVWYIRAAKRKNLFREKTKTLKKKATYSESVIHRKVKDTPFNENVSRRVTCNLLFAWE